MTDADKTVFISYRRDTSAFIARAIFQDLRANGYDVFMDVETIDNGPFDRIILNQIAARTHFLVILTPGSVERCVHPDGSENPDDWLRREVEYAIATGRNIVPLLINNFQFQHAERALTGKLAALASYNAVNVPHDYFDEAMTRLRTRFLKQPAPGNINPTPIPEQPIVAEKIKTAASQPKPTESQLTAEEAFDRAYQKAKHNDFQGALADWSEAIRLNPAFTTAYYNRGYLRHLLGDENGALDDFNHALRLEPDYVEAYTHRSYVYYLRGAYALCVADLTQVIVRDSTNARAYSNRGEAHFALGQYDHALADFHQAHTLHTGNPYAQAGIAVALHALGKTDQAIQQWQQLVAQNDNFRAVDWVQKELNWTDALVSEARALIAKL